MATNEMLKQGTLVDILNLVAPNGNLMTVAEILQRETPIFKDAIWQEANGINQHVYSVRTKLPTSQILLYNEGVAGNKGKTKQATVGMMARGNRPYYDARLVDMAADKAKYRMTEATAVIQGIGQEVDEDIIYASKADDFYKFDGLIRYPSEENGMLMKGKATEDSEKITSAYIVAWDFSEGAYLVYPKGSQGGVKFEDLGKRAKDLADGTVMEVYEDYVEANYGLCVVDERAVARICNIDVTNPLASDFDENQVIVLLNKMPGMLRSKAVMYVSRSVKSLIEIRANMKSNVMYGTSNVFGEEMTNIRGLPIRLDEKISEAEELVA
jgi:hypothetical protein